MEKSSCQTQTVEVRAYLIIDKLIHVQVICTFVYVLAAIAIDPNMVDRLRDPDFVRRCVTRERVYGRVLVCVCSLVVLYAVFIYLFSLCH